MVDTRYNFAFVLQGTIDPNHRTEAEKKLTEVKSLMIEDLKENFKSRLMGFKLSLKCRQYLMEEKIYIRIEICIIMRRYVILLLTTLKIVDKIKVIFQVNQEFMIFLISASQNYRVWTDRPADRDGSGTCQNNLSQNFIES